MRPRWPSENEFHRRELEDDVAEENRAAVTRRPWVPGDPIGPYDRTSDWCDELSIEDEPHDIERGPMFDPEPFWGGWGYR